MTTPKAPTDEELLLDIVTLHRDLGQMSYTLYVEAGAYNIRTICHRFGSFGKACAIVNIQPGRDAPKHEPKVIRTCIGCDVPFASPKNDPSCRRCATCRTNLQWAKPIDEGFVYTC